MQELQIQGMTLTEMANLAVKHHPLQKGFDYYYACISKRPSSWIDFCKQYQLIEKAEAKANRVPVFTEKQKELIDLIRKTPVWREYFNLSHTHKRTLQSLINRGVVGVMQYGGSVEYRINEWLLGK